jgi:hypothetical protein
VPVGPAVSNRARDYKAEYNSRVGRAISRGFNRSQARGHARAGEPPIRASAAKQPQNDERLERALVLYRKQGNQASAARAEGIGVERFRRFLRENVQVDRRGRTLRIIDLRPREMWVLSQGEAIVRRLRDFDQASLNGEHLNAVKQFLNSNDADLLEPFEGRSVIDVKGRAHLLETDPRALYRLAAAGSEVFHDVYRLIQ